MLGKTVICTQRNTYTITDTDILCLVIEKREGEKDDIRVKVLSGIDNGSTWWVNSECFQEISVDEYRARFPYISINESLLPEGCEISAYENPPLVMKMEENYIPSEEEVDSLVEECTELLEKYDYNPTDLGVCTFIEEFFLNKGPLINVFRKHPNYNGKFQIAFDSDFERSVDGNAIGDYYFWIGEIIPDYLTEFFVDDYSYEDYIYGNIADEKRNEIGETFRMAFAQDAIFSFGNKAYLDKDRETFAKFNKYRTIVWRLRNTLLTEEDVAYINEDFPEAKPAVGQKTSRIMNKIAKLIGIDKRKDYNREFAKYSDAINPLKIVRHTVLSVNPIDYLTMSFGNSWSSCHTIDKSNKRGMPHSYEGCYSAGTMSYALDGSSFVFYTVDGSYNGDQLELQPKISRCMFHVGEDKLVQARMYPQSTDGDKGVYSETREIVQRIISECFDFPNFWSIEKGTDACRNAIETKGVHYRDYLNFEYCNVTFPKNETGTRNYTKITVGHNPICPQCGCSHGNNACIECHDCWSNEVMCCNCGEYHERSEMYEIDGRWYCRYCSTYCDYHERREEGEEDDFYWVDGYGYVCDEAMNSGRFSYCNNCHEWRENSEGFETEDGSWFCCRDCAEDADYVYYKGVWYHNSRFECCPKCGELRLKEEIDAESKLCENCLVQNEEEVA